MTGDPRSKKQLLNRAVVGRCAACPVHPSLLSFRIVLIGISLVLAKTLRTYTFAKTLKPYTFAKTLHTYIFAKTLHLC